jgi:hypothetical protein
MVRGGLHLIMMRKISRAILSTALRQKKRKKLATQKHLTNNPAREEKGACTMTYTQAKEAIKEIGKEDLKELIERFGAALVNQYREDGYSLSDMEEAYQGEYSSDADFVQQLCEDIGDIPKDMPSYIHIDWDRTARDVMMDYHEINGHYFRQL